MAKISYPDRTGQGARFADPAGSALVGPDGVQIGLSARRSERKRLLVYGNSIASQSTVALAQATTASSAANAGATSIVVASVSGVSSGTKLAVGLYDGSVHLTTASANPVGNTVALTHPLPRYMRVSAPVVPYTTARSGLVRQGAGPISTAVMMLGMPVELTAGYGYGGATMGELIADLPRVLESVRPHFVALHLYENSIPAGATLAQCQAWTRAAVRIARGFGAVPIICTSVPSTSISNASRSAVFDGILAWVRTLGEEYVDFSSPWLDPTATTSRPPASGWATDGVHPDAARRFSAGVYALDTLARVLGSSAASYADMDLGSNTLLAGSGGTATSLVGGSVVAAGYTIAADAGVTATASKTSDDRQRLVMSVAGASNISSTTLTALKSVAVTAAAGGSVVVRAVCRVRVEDLTQISMLLFQVQCSGGEVYSVAQDAGLAQDPALTGRTLTLETPAFVVPEGATTIQPQLRLRPVTVASPSGVTASIVIEEMAVIPAALS